MKYGFLLIFILIWILSCNQHSSPSIKYQSFVDSSKENIWGADVRLSIENIKKQNGNTLYTLKSFYNNDTVGFQLLVPIKTDEVGSGSGLQLISLGKISKNFKNDLGQLYHLKVNTDENFINKLKLAFVELDIYANSVKGKDMIRLEGKDKQEGDVFKHFKLFFGDEKVSRLEEAEIFLNINERKKVVELREKDIEYRKAIIRFLSQQWNN